MSGSLLTAPALAALEFQTSHEITINDAEETFKNRTFEYLLKNVEAGTHHFVIYGIKNKKIVIGLTGSIEDSGNYFKLEAEVIPNTVVSTVPEPKIILMMLLGLGFGLWFTLKTGIQRK